MFFLFSFAGGGGGIFGAKCLLPRCICTALCYSDLVESV